jgi:hypothetical protein
MMSASTNDYLSEYWDNNKKIWTSIHEKLNGGNYGYSLNVDTSEIIILDDKEKQILKGQIELIGIIFELDGKKGWVWGYNIKSWECDKIKTEDVENAIPNILSEYKEDIFIPHNRGILIPSIHMYYYKKYKYVHGIQLPNTTSISCVGFKTLEFL